MTKEIVPGESRADGSSTRFWTLHRDFHPE